MLVSGVITQGARHTPDWVTEYRVSYSLDGQRWDYYKENGTAKVILYYTEYLWYIPMLSMLSTTIYRLNITYGLRSFLQNKSVVEGSGFGCSFNTISTFFTNTFCTLKTSLRFNYWTVISSLRSRFLQSFTKIFYSVQMILNLHWLLSERFCFIFVAGFPRILFCIYQSFQVQGGC